MVQTLKILFVFVLISTPVYIKLKKKPKEQTGSLSLIFLKRSFYSGSVSNQGCYMYIFVRTLDHIEHNSGCHPGTTLLLFMRMT